MPVIMGVVHPMEAECVQMVGATEVWTAPALRTGLHPLRQMEDRRTKRYINVPIVLRHLIAVAI